LSDQQQNDHKPQNEIFKFLNSTSKINSLKSSICVSTEKSRRGVEKQHPSTTYAVKIDLYFFANKFANKLYGLKLTKEWCEYFQTEPKPKRKNLPQQRRPFSECENTTQSSATCEKQQVWRTDPAKNKSADEIDPSQASCGLKARPRPCVEWAGKCTQLRRQGCVLHCAAGCNGQVRSQREWMCYKTSVEPLGFVPLSQQPTTYIIDYFSREFPVVPVQLICSLFFLKTPKSYSNFQPSWLHFGLSFHNNHICIRVCISFKKGQVKSTGFINYSTYFGGFLSSSSGFLSWKGDLTFQRVNLGCGVEKL